VPESATYPRISLCIADSGRQIGSIKALQIATFLQKYGELALSDDAPGAELLAKQLRGGGTAQPVVDSTGRDHGDGKAEAGVAKAGAGGAQEARLAAQQIEALEQAAVDANGHTAVGGGAADAER
jgi:hypothetical protein